MGLKLITISYLYREPDTGNKLVIQQIIFFPISQAIRNKATKIYSVNQLILNRYWNSNFECPVLVSKQHYRTKPKFIIFFAENLSNIIQSRFKVNGNCRGVSKRYSTASHCQVTLIKLSFQLNLLIQDLRSLEFVL